MMRIYWAIDFFERGGGFGVTIHRHKMKEALEAAGVEFVTDPQKADCAVHISGANQWQRVDQTRNVLFTTNELSPLRPEERTGIADADLLVVPCRFCRDSFARYFDGPVEVCPEGVDTDRFPFVERTEPSTADTFRYLFVGALGERKGAKTAIGAFRRWWDSGSMPRNVQLYIKASNSKHKGFLVLRPGPDGFVADPHGSIDDTPSVVIDGRPDLSTSELHELYARSHCFAFPTIGEGWGLTLTEAMATGLPSIWTHNTAMLDYADQSIGYPIIKTTRAPMQAGDTDFVAYGRKPVESEVTRMLRKVYYNYPTALEKGRAASRRMHERYRWDQAAEDFLEIVEQRVPA